MLRDEDGLMESEQSIVRAKYAGQRRHWTLLGGYLQASYAIREVADHGGSA